MKYLEPSHDIIQEVEVKDFMHTNNNTLYLQIGALDKPTVMDIVGKLVSKSSKFVKCECRYRVQIPSASDGTTFGIGYAWISDPRIRNIILGMNPDGTERYEEVLSSSGSELVEDDENDDWAAPVIKMEKVRTKKLPPLVGRYEVKYDAGLRQKARAMMARAKKTDINSISLDDTPTSYMLQTTPGVVYDVPADKIHNILYAERVKGWVTKELIQSTFTPYAVSGTISVDREGSEKSGWTYWVEFKEHTTDAAFALQMTRRCHLEKGNDSCDAFFDHCAKEDTEY